MSVDKREKVIEGVKCCAEAKCEICPYEEQCFGDEICISSPMAKDVLELLKAQEPADYIPIDWLMNYAQLPTEFAISAWRKPKKEAEIKQAKSLDKPMSLDDALELLKAQELRIEPKEG